MDSATGKVDRDKYVTNMDLATDMYISRVNDCLCGDGVIHLFKGTDSSQKQSEREYLLQYLKDTKKQNDLLKLEQPQLYSFFDQVWSVRKSHLVENVPPQYVFFPVCCSKTNCCHPICSSFV